MTSDLEREVVLAQNSAMRGRFHALPESFQKLRRCCICLRNSCGNPAPCRAEFEAWTRKKWDREVDRELERRVLPQDDHFAAYVGTDGQPPTSSLT